MAKRVIGLDVGSYSIKVAHVELRSRSAGLGILTCFEEKVEPSPVLEDPLMNLLERQQRTIDRLKDRGAFSGGPVASILAGSGSQIRELVLPFSEERKIEAVIAGELEAALPFLIETLQYGWYLIEQPASKKLKESQEQKQTAGHEILVGYAKKDAVHSFLAFLKELKLDPKWLYPQASVHGDFFYHILLKAKAELSSFDVRKPVAIIDIGYLQTTFGVFLKESQIVGRTIGRAGYGLTRSIAHVLKMSLEEAEQFKCERAFLETEKHQAKTNEEHLASEALKDVLLSLVREIRQTLLNVRSRNYEPVQEIILVGGGSKIPYLDVFLSQQLEMQVRAIHDMDVGGQHHGTHFSAALSCAISALLHEKRQNRLNLRKGEFVWKGELDHVRSKIKPLVLGCIFAYLFFVGYGCAQTRMLTNQLKRTEQYAVSLCHQIVGSKTGGVSQCLSLMRSQIGSGKTNKTTDIGALDIYLDIAQAIPPSIDIKVTELEITEESTKIVGETAGFETIDGLVEAVSKVKCFVNVEKGKARQTNEGVAFHISADVECEPKPKTPARTRKKA